MVNPRSHATAFLQSTEGGKTETCLKKVHLQGHHLHLTFKVFIVIWQTQSQSELNTSALWQSTNTYSMVCNQLEVAKKWKAELPLRCQNSASVPKLKVRVLQKHQILKKSKQYSEKSPKIKRSHVMSQL